MVSFCFLHRLQGLILVSAHSDLSNVDVAVGHCDLCKGLLGDGLTCRSELSDLTDLGSLGCLAAGIGVNLGIEYQNVYIFAGSENMIESAEADIICPAVTAENPLALLGNEVLVLTDVLALCALAVECFESSDESLGSSSLGAMG